MPTRPDDRPLIVTALLDEVGFADLDALRKRYFPAALNRVPAHVSLFHHLPGDRRDDVLIDVESACRSLRPFALRPVGTRFLGRGVAIAYEGADLSALHGRLAAVWAAWLTPQDRQPFRPHVTIQNKVAADTAKKLLAELDPARFPTCRVEGVALWRYLGGPWQPEAQVRFGPSTE